MSVFSGDFLGFSIGGIHSSQLNITRVSNNNRYTENLIPNFVDSTVKIPGGDGVYYWDTSFSQKPFSIDFAFDDLRDEDILRLRKVLGFKGVQPLIFDETPYKKYMVKCSAPPTLKFIGFDLNEVKVYKGEGSVNLVAYYPFGIGTVENVISSRSQYSILNNGELEAPLKFYYTIDTNSKRIELSMSSRNKSGSLVIDGVKQIGSADVNKYICIDTKTHLVEGVTDQFEKTGTLYNRYIESGDFFNLPMEMCTITSDPAWHQLRFNFLYY